MIKCSFVGSYQYDLDLYEKIQTEIKNIISKDNRIEFLFYRTSPDFYCLCFWAVKKAKQQFPSKRITISLISRQSEQDIHANQYMYFPGSWAFDKIIPVSESKKNSTSHCNIWDKIERKIVQESNYIIAYCYPNLHNTDYSLYKYSLNQSHISLINLANKETSFFIKQSIKSLPQQHILEQINSGCTYTSLAKSTGVTAYSIKSQDSKGRRLLRLKMNQLRKKLIEHSNIPTKVCSIISLVNDTNNSTILYARISNVLHSLIHDMNVASFMLEQDNLSLNMNYLTQISEEMELTVVTYTNHKSEMDIYERFDFPKTKIINLDTGVKPIWAKRLSSIKFMISHCDYVICNLSENTTLNNRIRSYLQKHKNITVIDIGNLPDISKQPLCL